MPAGPTVIGFFAARMQNNTATSGLSLAHEHNYLVAINLGQLETQRVYDTARHTVFLPVLELWVADVRGTCDANDGCVS